MSSRASLRVRVVSTSVIQSVVLGKVITAGSVKPDGPLWRRITRSYNSIERIVQQFYIVTPCSPYRDCFRPTALSINFIIITVI